MSRPPSPSHLLPPFRRSSSLDEAVSRLFEAGISSQKVPEDALGVRGSMGPLPEMPRVRCIMYCIPLVKESPKFLHTECILPSLVPDCIL